MKKSIAIIGSGPAALMLAAILDPVLFEVSIYEKNKAPGRKFLVAGQGGFNLTHAESPEELINRYSNRLFFEPLIHSFSNRDLVRWLNSIGIPTYTGSSKRVFPVKSIKPIDVLNAILKVLHDKNVSFFMEHEWMGWTPGHELLFRHQGEVVLKAFQKRVFALGGGSWKVAGSDGSWTKLMSDKGIEIIPFAASNCAFGIHWPNTLLESCEGKALKNISISCSGNKKKGELIITTFGLEGGAIYALSPFLRKELNANGKAHILLDLKPELSPEEIMKRLSDKRGSRSRTKQIEDQLKLDEVKVEMLRNVLSKEIYMDNRLLGTCIKQLPLEVHASAPIDEAISTSGGLSLTELGSCFQLSRMPDHYAIGEMLDWDAPTGGYLLQACFSMGYALATQLNKEASASEACVMS